MPLKFVQPASSAYSSPLLIKSLLHSSRHMAGERDISYRGELRFSYAAFLARVRRLGEMLTALGVGQGDTVAVMDWDSHRYLECYFAVPMLGAVLQTVNIRLAPAQIAYTLNDSGATVLVYHRDFAALVAGITQYVPSIGSRVFISDGSGDPVPDSCAGDYEELLARQPGVLAFPDFDENAMATCFHTTGTTGDPKMVAFSHRQLVLHTLATAAALGAHPAGISFQREIYMPLTPMFHVHAWGMPYLATMVGAKQVYPGRYEPARLLALKRDEGVTYSHCVPTILQMVLSAAEQSGQRLEGWNITIGGSRLSSSLYRAAAAMGVRVHCGYGMSETCPMVTTSWAEDHCQDEDRVAALTSAGYPVPLVEVALADPETGAIATDGRIQGELVVRAPWLTQAYPNKPDASEALWRDGWLHTQDLATIHGDGRITIDDRLKDVIKSGGEWVSAGTLEELTLTHPAVAEVAYVGVGDAKWGERPAAVIVARDGATLDCADLQAHLLPHVEAGLISRYALPVVVRTVDVFPKTSVGKIDKKALRALLAAEAGAS